MSECQISGAFALPQSKFSSSVNGLVSIQNAINPNIHWLMLPVVFLSSFTNGGKNFTNVMTSSNFLLIYRS
jgi:hypothetical protein